MLWPFLEDGNSFTIGWKKLTYLLQGKFGQKAIYYYFFKGLRKKERLIGNPLKAIIGPNEKKKL